ncbi:hypothetical protein Egran_04388 [Elaphomyces granulatus]|uniref:alpha-glucosidase n=1 Tax=Elaphomyces granulatus TaxID=519963 RepID=A0A232LUZ0_9EURO|nr:hypothetical protein Egran_04388 [Elaphomyces granulatus]
MLPCRPLSLLVILVSFLMVPGVTVKKENFKTCEQSGFCTRNRAYADDAGAKGALWTSPYELDSASIRFKNGQLHGTVLKTTTINEKVRLPLTVSFLRCGAARVVVDEERRMKGEIELRHGSTIRKERYNEAGKWALARDPELSESASLEIDKAAGYTKVSYGPDGRFAAIIRHTPFEVQFQRNGEIHVKLNDRGLLNVEQWRAKVDPPDGDSGEDQSTWWDETFGGQTDSKPRGPESIGLDIAFPGYDHVFGIPEHADSISLKETRGGSGHHDDPYRMYNADVFEYELNSPMSIYGCIPFMQAHRKNSTVGVFWLNAAETWVDIVKTKSSINPLAVGISSKTQTHWFSESGQLDVFIFLGPTAQDVSRAYGELTGYTQLPQHFAIAYHQSRWNYVTDEDVRDVDRKFDKYQIPYDVIWLDIEYTDGKRYFTFDPNNFPDPLGMEDQLDGSGRKVVLIIDPHLKNVPDYQVDHELKSKGLGVKDKDGNLYEGWCWPGSSHWIDCFNPAAISWWAHQFKYDKFKGTSPNCFIWNDMNEPSVFNLPETTMPKHNIHYDGWEHRDVHNLYGLTYMSATYHGLLERKKGVVRRPFVLTRSFYAGAQRVGATWTGDNLARWDHLAASIPMVLNNGIAGFPFVGADVGGFFGNPDKELLTRWYQTGIFYPFFRAHAHIDSRRREPYLAGEPYVTIITQAIRLRYQLLPAWYTTFYQASVEGLPIVRPQYYIHPDDEHGFAIDDQLYIGSTGLLAKPVVTEGAASVDIYLADSERYYDYFDYTIYQGAGRRHTVPAPLEKIPLLMQGGHIIPRKDRPRRSSALMKWDPYTLVIALGKDGEAEGSIYIDDGESFDYQRGAYIHRNFQFGGSALWSEDIGTKGPKTGEYLKTMAGVKVEKLVVVGAPQSWQDKLSVTVIEEDAKSSTTTSLQFHAAQGNKAAYAVVKNPNVAIGKSWKIEF